MGHFYQNLLRQEWSLECITAARYQYGNSDQEHSALLLAGAGGNIEMRGGLIVILRHAGPRSVARICLDNWKNILNIRGETVLQKMLNIGS